MTLQQLLKLGVTNEVAKQVLEIHKSTIKDKYVPIWRFTEVNSKYKELKLIVENKENQINKLKIKATEKEELVTKIMALEELNKINKECYESKIDALQKEKLTEIYLRDQKIKSIKTAKAMLDFLLD
ncbi:phage scaffolding protein [Alkaliphilus sp. B6464]|uniref:phage scaffolding protein n=1 Tax=Alkaliphilus sp. B6464 TaxID=2731219 RepID=UPI001BACC615|nr:phage scaffolding protein [Alkaliphilus sp. B6464]QUH18940.1 phage scaffolding protein [Alkaliphilus sp. B6464]